MLNERKFRSLYDDYPGSGLTIRVYCANHQINEAKFYYWKKKLKHCIDFTFLNTKKGFYKHWLNGMSKHDAFREAQKEVRLVFPGAY